MPTPEERSIRKTDLWERDDRLNEVIQRKAEESKRLSDAVAIELNRQMDDFKGYVTNLKKDYQLKFETNLLKAVEKLESEIANATKKLNDAVEKQNEFINSLFQKFRKESDNSIADNISDRLDKFQRTALDLGNSWVDYRKIFADQMTKYQADTFARYDELNKVVVKLMHEVERLKK